jgi:acetyl-CoA carboxylase carboxyl transferase subunit alpha
MLEQSVYSVISPEGCASILWKNAEKMREAAEALRLTAQDLYKLGVADVVIPEPLGGAQRHREQAIKSVSDTISDLLKDLKAKKPDVLRKERRQKYLDLGSKSLV